VKLVPTCLPGSQSKLSTDVDIARLAVHCGVRLAKRAEALLPRTTMMWFSRQSQFLSIIRLEPFQYVPLRRLRKIGRIAIAFDWVLLIHLAHHGNVRLSTVI
jgi:hypothetical protein